MAKPAHPFLDKYPAKQFQVLLRPRASNVGHLYCCGVKEYHGIQNNYVFENNKNGYVHYELIPLNELVNDFFARVRENHPHRPHWIFSDNDEKTSPGEALAKYIEANDLGTVLRTGYATNFNSRAKVQTYLATLKPEAMHHKYVA